MIIFDLDIEGDIYKDVYVEVSEEPKSGPDGKALVISKLHGYAGPLNYEVLRGSIEFYFRQVTGSKKFHITGPGKFLSLTDWTIEHEMVVQFEMPEEVGN